MTRLYTQDQEAAMDTAKKLLQTPIADTLSKIIQIHGGLTSVYLICDVLRKEAKEMNGEEACYLFRIVESIERTISHPLHTMCCKPECKQQQESSV